MKEIDETSFSRSGKWSPGHREFCEPVEVTGDKPATDEGSEKSSLKLKIIKSVILISTWVCMGLYSGITGPTVPDLGERLGVEYDSLGLAIALRSVGKMMGSMTCGYLRDRSGDKGDIVLSAALALVGVSVVTKPWVPTVELLTFVYFTEGFGHVGNSMIVLMWQEKAALPVHLLHFGYGVGALVVPVIASPFLSIHTTINITEPMENSSSATSGSFLNPNGSVVFPGFVNDSWEGDNSTVNQTTKDIIVKASQIEIPYGIVSAIVFITSMVYLSSYLYKPIRDVTAIKGKTSYSKPCDAPFLKDRPKSALAIIGLIFFYYMMTSAIDRALGSFLFTYAVESDIGFSKSDAAYLNTGFYACYAAGRVGIGLFALRLPIKIILFCEVYLMSLCAAIITFYAYDKFILLWVFSCSLAFFFGPIYPSGVAWVDRYVPLYGLVMAIFDIGNGIGAFTANWISGHLITSVGPRSFLYFTFGCACLLCGVIVLAQIVGEIRGDRHSVEKQKEIPEKVRNEKR